MRARRFAWGVAALAAAAPIGGGGCVQEGVVAPSVAVPDSGPTSTTEAREHAVAGVVDRIARATCDREQSCNTIGPGATFGSLEDCRDTIRTKYAKELSASECPGGIDKSALDDCLGSLDSGQCSGPGDEITRAATCSTKSMCLK